MLPMVWPSGVVNRVQPLPADNPHHCSSFTAPEWGAFFSYCIYIFTCHIDCLDLTGVQTENMPTTLRIEYCTFHQLLIRRDFRSLCSQVMCRQTDKRTNWVQSIMQTLNGGLYTDSTYTVVIFSYYYWMVCSVNYVNFSNFLQRYNILRCYQNSWCITVRFCKQKKQNKHN